MRKTDVVDAELARIRSQRKAREANNGKKSDTRKPKPPTELPSPNNPMAVARKFVEHAACIRRRR